MRLKTVRFRTPQRDSAIDRDRVDMVSDYQRFQAVAETSEPTLLHHALESKAGLEMIVPRAQRNLLETPRRLRAERNGSMAAFFFGKSPVRQIAVVG
jgi:hypothetical protein